MNGLDDLHRQPAYMTVETCHSTGFKTCFLHIINPKQHGPDVFEAVLYTLTIHYRVLVLLMVHACLILHV